MQLVRQPKTAVFRPISKYEYIIPGTEGVKNITMSVKSYGPQYSYKFWSALKIMASFVPWSWQFCYKNMFTKKNIETTNVVRLKHPNTQL